MYKSSFYGQNIAVMTKSIAFWYFKNHKGEFLMEKNPNKKANKSNNNPENCDKHSKVDPNTPHNR